MPIVISKTDFASGDALSAVELNKIAVNSNLLLKTMNAGEALTITVPKPVYVGDGASFNSTWVASYNGGSVRLDDNNSKKGEYFVIPSNYRSFAFTKIRYKLQKVNSPTGTLAVNIYATDVNHRPTGASLGQQTMNIASISTSLTDYEFTFNLSNLTPGVEYIAWVSVSGGTVNGSNYINFQSTASDLVSNCGSTSYDGPSTSWGTTANDLDFTITFSYTLTVSGKIYNAKANDTAKLNVFGWILSTVAKDADTLIQLGGIVSGFTGLTLNAKYYLKDDGTIGTTVGTNTVMVGIAISATELLFTRA